MFHKVKIDEISKDYNVIYAVLEVRYSPSSPNGELFDLKCIVNKDRQSFSMATIDGIDALAKCELPSNTGDIYNNELEMEIFKSISDEILKFHNRNNVISLTDRLNANKK